MAYEEQISEAVFRTGSAQDGRMEKGNDKIREQVSLCLPIFLFPGVD